MLHMQSLGLKPTCLEVGSFGFLLFVQVYVCVSADLARYTLDFVIMDNTHRALDIHNDTHNYLLEVFRSHQTHVVCFTWQLKLPIAPIIPQS